MSAFSWDSPTFGLAGSNVHIATSGNYGTDAGHDDASNGDSP